MDSENDPADNLQLKCPLCNQTNLEDISPKISNGVLGPGSFSSKLIDLKCCPDCRIVLHQPKKQ